MELKNMLIEPLDETGVTLNDNLLEVIAHDLLEGTEDNVTQEKQDDIIAANVIETRSVRSDGGQANN